MQSKCSSTNDTPVSIVEVWTRKSYSFQSPISIFSSSEVCFKTLASLFIFLIKNSISMAIFLELHEMATFLSFSTKYLNFAKKPLCVHSVALQPSLSFFMLFINVSQLIYIKKNVSISPFSADLLKLFGLTIICMYFAINQSYNFKLIHFILIPIGVYLACFLLMLKPIKSLIKELR